MTFIHNDGEWGDLLRIVADEVGRDIALVEKDYWVTHTLWALHAQGFDIWLKGGTSLSTRDHAGSDRYQRAAAFEVAYPALHAAQLPEAMRPFVLLEVGRARVVPFVKRPLQTGGSR